MSDELRAEAQRMLEEAEEYLVLVRTPEGYSYIWRTEEPGLWSTPFQEFLEHTSQEGI